MKTLLTLLLLTITASASWYYPPTDKEYTTKPASITGVSNPTVYEVHEFSAPSGTVAVVGTRQIVWDGSTATETYQTETQDEADARQKAAQVAQLQAIVDAAGDQIRQLEAIIDKYSIPRPASPMICLALIGAAKDAAKASNDAMGVAEAGADGVILLTLYSGLADAGVDAATVNAAWQYMVATGQDGAE